MTIRKLKTLLWCLGAAGFFAAAYTFYGIWEAKQERQYEPKEDSYYHELIRRDLAEVAAEGASQAYYSKERYETVWKARIDGSVKELPKAEGSPADAAAANAQPALEPLDQVLRVSSIVWSEDPLERWISVEYLQDTGAAALLGGAGKVNAIHVSEGGALRPPYDAAPYHGRVLGIETQSVSFQWGEAPVALTPSLGRDGKERPQTEFAVRAAVDLTAAYGEAPQETVELAPGSFLIGRKDRAELAADPQKVLRDDLSLRSLPPGKDGGRSSLELTKVAPDSLPARYGFQSGDRIISVNGVPMVSEAAAINWYKANSDEPAYHIVYESRGALKNLSIHVK